MNNKEKSLPFGRLGMTRGSLRRNRGRRETNLPFSEIILKDIHHLESQEWLKWGNKGRDRRPFSVGVVKGTTNTEIVPIKMAKQELSITVQQAETVEDMGSRDAKDLRSPGQQTS
jgi:hypothetical protein